MGKVKVTFMLDEQVRTDLRVYAAKKGKTISDTIELAIINYLKREANNEMKPQ